MKSVIHIYLFGSLSVIKEQGRGECCVEVPLQKATPMVEVLRFVGIPQERVSLAMVNHRSVPKEWVVEPGDRVGLFPKEYPIFADWNDHRF